MYLSVITTLILVISCHHANSSQYYVLYYPLHFSPISLLLINFSNILSAPCSLLLKSIHTNVRALDAIPEVPYTIAFFRILFFLILLFLLAGVHYSVLEVS